MNIVITPKFEVCGQYFDSIEEAEKYLAEHEDQARVEAYTQYLRDNGAQRINKSVTETVLDFIQFEKGKQKPEPETAEPSAEASQPTTPEEETAAPAEAEAEALAAKVPSDDDEKPPFTADKPVGKSLFANSDAAAEAEAEEEPAEEVPAAVVEQQAATTTRKSLFAS